MSTSQARTARKARNCWNCSPGGSLAAPAAIQPGHRYLRHVAFPYDEGNERDQLWVLNECASCTLARNPALCTQYGICGTYCHGTNPCVLPFQRGAPGHDCVCRRCLTGERARV